MNQHGKKVSNIFAQQSQLSVSVKVVFWCYLSVEAIACFTPIKHMVSTFQHGSSTTMKCFCGQLAGGQCFFFATRSVVPIVMWKQMKSRFGPDSTCSCVTERLLDDASCLEHLTMLQQTIHGSISSKQASSALWNLASVSWNHACRFTRMCIFPEPLILLDTANWHHRWAVMSCGKVSWAGLKRSDEVVALIRRLFSSFDDRWFIVASGSHVFSASMAVGAEGVDHRHRSPEQILACGLYCRRDLTRLCQHAQCSVSLSCCSVSLTHSAGLWFFCLPTCRGRCQFSG